MTIQRILPNLYIVPLGYVNTYLVDGPDGLTLIDTGSPGQAGRILQAVARLRPAITDLQHIIVTHAHPDHIGSLADLQQATGARIYAHAADRAIVESGQGFRPLAPSPGLINGMVFRLAAGLSNRTVGATAVDQLVADGDRLPNDLTAIHAPGHCAGQIVLRWPAAGGVLIAADACGNLARLGLSMGYEDLAEGRRTLHKLAQLDFALACFGHGRVIGQDAAGRFRRLWPA